MQEVRKGIKGEFQVLGIDDWIMLFNEMGNTGGRGTFSFYDRMKTSSSPWIMSVFGIQWGSTYYFSRR